MGGSPRGTSSSRSRPSAGCIAGSSPTSRARTGCSSGSRRTALADQAEFLVGNGRYRFDAPQPVARGDGRSRRRAGRSRARPTAGPTAPGPFRPPALTELIGSEIGNRALLVKPEYWIGSDPTCPICRPDDPFCEPRHVRVFRGPKGAGHAEHNKTRNGLWLRMSQIVVESMIQFQIGEQRFRLKVQ